MAQIAPQTQAPPTLLGLPRELRDEIYDYVFQAQESFDVIISGHHHPHGKEDTRFFVSYPLPETPEADHVPRSPRELRWLLANKQICAEGFQQFQRKAMWVLPKDSAISQAFEAMGGVPSVNRGGARRFTDRLIMPHDARNLIVQVLVLTSDRLELDCRENMVWKVDLKEAGAILRLNSERPRSQQLRTLSITLYTPEWISGYHHAPARAEFLDLPPLDGMELLQMEFRMYPREHLLGRPDPISTPVFEEALDELGMTLVGGGGVKTHTTASIGSMPVAVLTYTRK